MGNADTFDHQDAIAIIGMTCRFPGARNVEAFWQNLQDGVESLSFFSDQELKEAGVAPAVIEAPNYVKANSVLEDAELFDAAFFKINPREAELMDPQHRLLLECAWEVLERAGYDPEAYPGRIGVYAGAEMSTYRLKNLSTNPQRLATVDGLQVLLGTDRAYLSTRVSYELNLKGPSLTVQTSCSTSLVATHLACESLLNSECDMALVGGATVSVPIKTGYFYQENGVLSPDGHCRAFDAQAKGTVFGSGVGVVVLKRLADALVDGDCVHAVIRGSAINNDGAAKVGFTAPSVEGQSAAIAEAMAIAGVEPETITYVESHGTGTELGDPIEVTALTQAFQLKTDKKGFCAIGAVKTNVGHLGTAAGMAGMIKTVLALKHGLIPPSLHFEQPNPAIDFDTSPFYVNTALSEWRTNGLPRRAGVSSFGMGGTNAHVVLEQAPPVVASKESRPWHLLQLSAKTDSALEKMTDNLAAHLTLHPDLNLADVAYTLQVGRRPFDYRRTLVCGDLDDAVSTLETRDPKRVFTSFQEESGRPVAFMFPGLGDQYPNMALELYRTEPAFRAHVDRCAELLEPHLGVDLREVLFPDKDRVKESAQGENELVKADESRIDLRKMLGRVQEETVDAAAQRLNQTSFAHPAVFVIEYALAQLLMEWGIRPQAMVGHSIGEYVAACLSGVLSLQDALTLVARRAQMIQALPGGAMLALPLSEKEVQPLLGEKLSLSAINGPSLCIVGGPEEAIAELEAALIERDVVSRRVQTSHAFHSKMLEPIVAPLTEVVKTFKLKPPEIPYVSNLTGTWITAEQATDPHYWARHSRHPVRFADGAQELLRERALVLLEIGPGHTLTSLAIQHPASQGDMGRAVSTMHHLYERGSDRACLLDALGQLWLAGVSLDWEAFYGDERRLRVPLPTYPFEGIRYWVEPGARAMAAPALPAEQSSISDWFYVPSWKRTAPLIRAPRETARRWLLFGDGKSLSKTLARQLGAQGDQVVIVLEGERFASKGDAYTIRPAQSEDYQALMGALGERDQVPDHIVHLWNVAPLDKKTDERAQETLKHSFYSLLFLAQALGEQTPDIKLTVVASHLLRVNDGEVLCPERATLLGACRVIPREMPGVTCRGIDVVLPRAGSPEETQLVEHISAEIESEARELVVAYRGRDRWAQIYEPMSLPEVVVGMGRTVREGGSYLITGGLAGVGLALAKHLAQTSGIRLALITRHRLPKPEALEGMALQDLGDDVRLRLEAVQELEALGAQVLVLRADVANQSQVEAACRVVREQFGAIHGVVHAAGQPAGEDIPSETEASAAGILEPKMQGARALARALREVPLDFMLFCSSLTTLVGEAGQMACTGANAFIDAFAHACEAHAHTQVMAVNWDTRQEDNSGETGEVFRRVLAHNCLPQVAVCTQHLPTLIAQPGQLARSRAREGASETASTEYPRPNLPTAFVAPESDVEEELAAMWQQLLGVRKVGRNDSFFRLGGHSLVALQLINRVRDTFDIDMSLQASFEAPTIAELAKLIKAARAAADTASAKPVVPISREGDLETSFAQHQLWLLDQPLAAAPPRNGKERSSGGALGKLSAAVRRVIEGEVAEPGSSEGTLAPEQWVPRNVFSTMRLTGALDVATLERSVEGVVRRHEILRTTFVDGDPTPLQVIAPHLAVTLPLIDLRSFLKEEQALRMQQLVVEELERPFDLAQGPLWRATLVALGAEEHALLLNMHRIVSDDRSVELFLHEMMALYEAFCTETSPSLPELPVQYADFAAWQRGWLSKTILHTQNFYWKRQLGDEPLVLELPTDRPRSSGQGAPKMRRSFTLPPALAGSLKALSQSQESTLFMTLLAAFKTLLHRYTGQGDIVVGAPIINRNRSELEGLIGLFGNMLPLHTDLGDDPTFDELLRRVRKGSLEAQSNSDLPFETLVAEYGADRPPLVQVLFAFENQPLETLALSGLCLSDLEIDGRGTGFDLTLSIQDTQGGLEGAWEYNAGLFEDATIARLADWFPALLEDIVKDPERPLSTLSPQLGASQVLSLERHQKQ